MSHSYEQFRSDLYFAYDCLEKYIEEKYNITMADYADYPSEYHEGISYQDSILSKDLIANFIERVSNINIEEYIKKIKSVERNVKP